MLHVLGINPLDPVWRISGDDGSGLAEQALDSLVQALIEQRTEARANKDFATSDAIRDSLHSAGVALEDTPNGTRWSLS